MSVNGVNSVNSADAYKTYAASSKAAEKTAENTKPTDKDDNKGVVYEASKETKKYTPNTELVNKSKADAEARTNQLQSIVQQMISKQGNSFGAANDMWKFLASGNYKVDAATKLQAQKDISEDGYWGVKQTSDRIIDFATALTGGNPDKIEDMRSAFKKGYDAAAKKWGGELPDISKRTYDAVMEKFDKLAADAKKPAEASGAEA